MLRLAKRAVNSRKTLGLCFRGRPEMREVLVQLIRTDEALNTAVALAA